MVSDLTSKVIQCMVKKKFTQCVLVACNLVSSKKIDILVHQFKGERRHRVASNEE